MCLSLKKIQHFYNIINKKKKFEKINCISSNEFYFYVRGSFLWINK